VVKWVVGHVGHAGHVTYGSRDVGHVVNVRHVGHGAVAEGSHGSPHMTKYQLHEYES